MCFLRKRAPLLNFTSLRSIGTLYANEYRKAIAPGKRRYFKRKGARKQLIGEMISPCALSREPKPAEFQKRGWMKVDYMAR